MESSDKKTEHKKIIVQRIKDLPLFENDWAVVCDTETTGLHTYFGDRICGISIGSLHSDVSYYIPVRHSGVPVILCEPGESLFNDSFSKSDTYLNGKYVNLDSGLVFEWMSELMKDTHRIWIFHNAKFDLKMLRAAGVECLGKVLDTMLIAHSLNSSFYSYSLDFLTKKYLNFKHVKYEKLKTWFLENFKVNIAAKKHSEGQEPPNYSFAPIDILGEYAIEDLEATRKLALSLDKNFWIKAPYNQGNLSWSQRELCQNECKLVKVIFEMENKGVLINTELLDKLKRRTDSEIELFTDNVYAIAGFKFNVFSTSQVAKAFAKSCGKVLFWNKPEFKNKHKFPNLSPKEFAGKQKKDKFTMNKENSTGNACFNSAAVAEYLATFKRNGNAKSFNFIYYYWSADHRNRIKSTYLDGISRMLDHDNVLHTSFNQHGTVHGRFSSSGPNLQNIAKSSGNRDLKIIEKILDRKDNGALNRQIRKLFIPRPGYTWVCIDWKQIEYLVATYFSCDEDMIRLFYENASLDYHQVTADMAKIDRDTAKTVNFGILYGIGPASLGALLGISYRAAKSIIDKVYNSRPALKRLIMGVQEEAKRDGYVQNPLGRKVHVDFEKAYVGLNYLVAGTVGDMMKERMVAIYKEIEKKGWTKICHLLLTVHDELDFEIKTEYVGDIARHLARVMCDVRHIQMPVRCDIEVGSSWGEIEELDIWEKKRGLVKNVKS